MLFVRPWRSANSCCILLQATVGSAQMLTDTGVRDICLSGQ